MRTSLRTAALTAAALLAMLLPAPAYAASDMPTNSTVVTQGNGVNYATVTNTNVSIGDSNVYYPADYPCVSVHLRGC